MDSNWIATVDVKSSNMPYLYGATDEKHVRASYEPGKKRLKPLDTFKFKLSPVLEGKQRMKLGEASIRSKASPDLLVELCSPAVNAIPLAQPYQWRTVEVADWIKKLGFPQYQNTFKQNNINGRILLRMDASYLSKINIKHIEHIQVITDSIRKLYGFANSSSLMPDDHYKFFCARTGPKYEKTRRTDFYRMIHVLQPCPLYETHWQRLERWLKHLRPAETELIGRSIQTRYNLFYTRKAQPLAIVQKKIGCDCHSMPPCICEWTDKKHLREPWNLKCLTKIFRHDRCICIEPNTCERCKVQGITILKMHVPHKYAGSDVRISIDPSVKVRFSQKST